MEIVYYWTNLCTEIKVYQIKVREYRKGNQQDNPEKLATQGTHNDEKQNTIGAGHHYSQTNTNNVNKTRDPPQTNR